MFGRSLTISIIYAVAGLLVMASRAGAVALVPGNFITAGHATVTLETCFEGLGACDGQFVSTPGPGDGFVIEGIDDMPLLAPAMMGQSIMATFVVSTTAARLNSVTLSAAGEAFGAGSAGASERITDVAGTLIGSGFVAAGSGSDAITWAVPESEIVITKTMFADSSFFGTAILVSVTQVLSETSVPEPSDVAVVVVALLSLAGVRHVAGRQR